MLVFCYLIYPLPQPWYLFLLIAHIIWFYCICFICAYIYQHTKILPLDLIVIFRYVRKFVQSYKNFKNNEFCILLWMACYIYTTHTHVCTCKSVFSPEIKGICTQLLYLFLNCFYVWHILCKHCTHSTTSVKWKWWCLSTVLYLINTYLELMLLFYRWRWARVKCLLIRPKTTLLQKLQRYQYQQNHLICLMVIWSNHMYYFCECHVCQMVYLCQMEMLTQVRVVQNSSVRCEAL